MKESNKINVALIGNPNSGKSSLFNLLTGMRQHVSNFPGVTVEKKSGVIDINGRKFEITDFPGTYSMFPNSSDERIVVNILTNPSHPQYPDLIIYVADIHNLERHLLLASQINDLGFDMILLLNMVDLTPDFKSSDFLSLKKIFPGTILPFSTKTHLNLNTLKEEMANFDRDQNSQLNFIFDKLDTKVLGQVSKVTNVSNQYFNKLILHHYAWLDFVTPGMNPKIEDIAKSRQFENIKEQVSETMLRYDAISPLASKTSKNLKIGDESFTEKIDNIVTNRIFGPILFFALMFGIFQILYSWATLPMEWIESLFNSLSTLVSDQMPKSWFTDLIVEGIIPGLGGIAVFVPQIALLFLIISTLEEIGYMSRAVYMFDGLLRKFGLNGRSIVALVSSGACAIPAIMSTRTITNWKERLITILVTPLISCSARLPVYIVLIGFVVPAGTVYGFNKQGLAFMVLYLIGIIAALSVALILKYVIKSGGDSFLMIELPNYKKPIFKNILLVVKEKVQSFIVEAGKIIFFISIILWFLSSYGPGNEMATAEQEAKTVALEQQLDAKSTNNLIASAKIESSYAGHLGKWIEPAIRPLGFDWKIGIALITSFAAREVFVGTMATIYSIGSDNDELNVRQIMAQQLKPGTNRPMYDRATSMSLLIFYVFAMQCMSTLAVVKRETFSWKWPIIQFTFMSLLAYLSSLAIYQIFS